MKNVLVSSLVLFCLVNSPSGLFAQSTITNIPSLGGSVQAASALNQSGTVVGFSRTPADADQHAFLFNGGVTYDLGGYFSAAAAINAAGQVCGSSSISNTMETHAFLFALGGNTDLGTLGGADSVANAINDSGWVAGTSTLSDGLPRAFLYTPAGMTNLGTLGGDSSSGVALNNAGQVAGESSTTNGESHAFLYGAGSMLDLGTLGGSSSSSTALNALGQVAGDADTTNQQNHGFFFSGGVMSDVGTFGGSSSTVKGLNDSGQVVGKADLTNDLHNHAFLYSAGVLTDLGSFGGDSSALAINNLGQIVGFSLDASGTLHPFLWQAGTMTDLNTLLPPNSGWVLQSASLINDASQVVGVGTFNGDSSLFLLTLPGHRPPIANAGPDQTVECSATVTLNGSGSTSSDGSPLTFEWRENNTLLATGATPSVSLGLGSHSIVLTVTDSHGATDQATVVITIVDTTPPTVTCPEPLVASAGTDSQAVVPDIRAAVTASDSCPSTDQLVITQSPVAGTVVGIGSYNIIVTVTDASGIQNSCTTSFTVQAEQDKITICHKRRITLTVSSQALAAHLAHGDTIGRCEPKSP